MVILIVFNRVAITKIGKEFVFFIVLGTLLTVVLTVKHLNGGKEDSENEE